MNPVGFYLLLIGLTFVANLPFVFYLITKRKDDMAISSNAQAIIDSLNKSNSDLTTALASAGAQEAEDLAAIKSAADTLSASIAAAMPAQG